MTAQASNQIEAPLFATGWDVRDAIFSEVAKAGKTLSNPLVVNRIVQNLFDQLSNMPKDLKETVADSLLLRTLKKGASLNISPFASEARALYTGQVNSEQFQGLGILVVPGQLYVGDFVQSKLSGKGIYATPEAYFVGDFENNQATHVTCSIDGEAISGTPKVLDDYAKNILRTKTSDASSVTLSADVLQNMIQLTKQQIAAQKTMLRETEASLAALERLQIEQEALS